MSNQRGPKPSGRQAYRIYIKPEAFAVAEKQGTAEGLPPSRIIERLLLAADEPKPDPRSP